MIARVFVLAQSAVLAGCVAPGQQESLPPVEYTAVQTIDTVPGPFVNRIYVTADRERQDAALGGTTVTTIIRRDKGVAWLLVAASGKYEEVVLDKLTPATFQAGCAGLERRRVGREALAGQTTERFACHDAEGRQVASVWVSADGIPLKADVPGDALDGKPAAVILLQDVRIGALDPALFEIPAGYTRLEAHGPTSP